MFIMKKLKGSSELLSILLMIIILIAVGVLVFALATGLFNPNITYKSVS